MFDIMKTHGLRAILSAMEEGRQDCKAHLSGEAPVPELGLTPYPKDSNLSRWYARGYVEMFDILDVPPDGGEEVAA